MHFNTESNYLVSTSHTSISIPIKTPQRQEDKPQYDDRVDGFDLSLNMNTRYGPPNDDGTLFSAVESLTQDLWILKNK